MVLMTNSPWHGACFHVQTGDIEDGPGFDTLRKYSVEIVDNQVVVGMMIDEDGKRNL